MQTSFKLKVSSYENFNVIYIASDNSNFPIKGSRCFANVQRGRLDQGRGSMTL